MHTLDLKKFWPNEILHFSEGANCVAYILEVVGKNELTRYWIVILFPRNVRFSFVRARIPIAG